MKKSGWILAAAAALFGAAAQAEEITPLFKRLCLDQSTDGSAQLAAARQAGFVRIPSKMTNAFPTDFVSNPAVLWKVADERVEMFIGGNINAAKSPLGPEFDGPVCAVMTIPIAADPVGKMQALLGMKPATTQADTAFFAYAEKQGQRTAINPDRQANVMRAANAGELRMVAVMSRIANAGAEGTMLMLMTPLSSRVSAGPAETTNR